MARTRAERRVKNRQVKAKFRSILNMYRFGYHGAESEARTVGRWASTHGRPCSCMGCKRGPRPSKAPPIYVTDFEPDNFYRTLEDDRDADYELDMMDDYEDYDNRYNYTNYEEELVEDYDFKDYNDDWRSEYDPFDTYDAGWVDDWIYSSYKELKENCG